MKRGILLLTILSIFIGSCGPDLNPQKYLVSSVQWNSFEEYYFQYQNDRLQNVTGTDSIRSEYTYYKDSTAIKQYNKSGKLVQRTQLAFSGTDLKKVKVKWLFSNLWYRDSIQFFYSGSSPVGFAYRGNLYQVTTQNGNLQNIRRGIGNLSVSYTQTHDQFANPFQSVYWLDPFLLPSGFTTTLQPKSMARYFSKNNMSTSISVVLGATTTERFNYFYVNGILPKSINYEIETTKNKVSDLVYVFDIQYRPKESAGF